MIGFPLGATLADVKAYEARRAIFDGAREVDMVINVGALKSGDDCLVEHDIRSVVEVAHEYNVTCKVIIETALLTDDEKVRACPGCEKRRRRLCQDFDRIFQRRRHGGRHRFDATHSWRGLGVKASGGVKGFEDARAMVEAGATRSAPASASRLRRKPQVMSPPAVSQPTDHHSSGSSLSYRSHLITTSAIRRAKSSRCFELSNSRFTSNTTAVRFSGRR